MLHTGSAEVFAFDLDGFERRNEMMELLAEANDTVVQQLPVGQTHIVENKMAELVVRDDVQSHGVLQALQGVIRAGSYGFGIVTAYSKDIPPDGKSFVVQLNEVGYDAVRRPTLIGLLEPGSALTIGGITSNHPMAIEGGHIVAEAVQPGYWKVRSDSISQQKLDWVTAARIACQGFAANPLHNSLNTWAMPPSKVKRLIEL